MRTADFITAVFFCFCVIAAQASTITYYGEAKDPESSELLYREFHTLKYDNGFPVRRDVDYINPQGELMVRKTNIYTDNPLTPSFNLMEPETGYREALNTMSGQLQMILQEPGKPAQQEYITIPDDLLVVDAGFDELIRSYWQTLIKGEEMTFYFASVARFDLIHFRVKRVKSSDPAKIIIRMQLASRLLAWLLDPIELEYDANSQKLLSYQGLTNIRSASGSNYIATIKYFYP